MKKLLVLGFVAAMAMAMSLPANALTGPKLGKFTDGSGSEIGWVRGNDSPNDSNQAALSIRNDSGEYAYAYSGKYATPADSGATSIAVGTVKNLSFDFLNAAGGGYVGAGAPRISVVFTDGSVAYLSALYCDTVTSDPNWSRADFTGQKAPGCAIYTSAGLGGSATPFASDGTNSAWANLAAANPTARVDYAFYITDEATVSATSGRSLVDRIAIFRYMQDAGQHVKACTTEASC